MDNKLISIAKLKSYFKRKQHFPMAKLKSYYMEIKLFSNSKAKNLPL